MAHCYIEFTVSGKGSFPFDMLRYDRCYPIETGFDYMVTAKGVRSLRMGSVRRSIVDAYPTVARWQSFGWIVTRLEVYEPNEDGRYVLMDAPTTKHNPF